MSVYRYHEAKILSVIDLLRCPTAGEILDELDSMTKRSRWLILGRTMRLRTLRAKLRELRRKDSDYVEVEYRGIARNRPLVPLYRLTSAGCLRLRSYQDDEETVAALALSH